MSLNIKTMQETDLKDFEDKVNAFANSNVVRATQTHVTEKNSILIYTAVIFYEASK